MIEAVLFFVALSGTQVDPAAAKSSANVQVSSASNAESKADKLQCRNLSETGTRFPVRICKKRSEWAAEQREQKASLRGANRQSGTCDIRC